MEPLSSPPALRLFCSFLNFMLTEFHCMCVLVSGFFCSHWVCEIHPADNAVVIALLNFPALLYCPLASIWSVCISGCPSCPQKKKSPRFSTLAPGIEFTLLMFLWQFQNSSCRHQLIFSYDCLKHMFYIERQYLPQNQESHR